MKAELTYPREALYLYYYLRQVTKCIRYVAAGFFNEDASEATICSPFPLIPGYDSLCNYTGTPYTGNSFTGSLFTGSSFSGSSKSPYSGSNTWYCGKPRKPQLTCAHWKTVRDLDWFNPFPLRTDEMLLIDDLKNGPKFRLIPGTLTINVNSGVPVSPGVPCPTRGFSDTWDISAHRGYFLGGRWFRMDCKQQVHTNTSISSCLTNTTLLYIGDSNLLTYFYTLLPRIECQEPKEKRMHWHKPRLCTRPDINLKMTWHIHGLPYHDTPDHWSPRSDSRLHDVINSVPDSGRYIVVVHLYTHYSAHHYKVVYDRLQSVRLATESLLRRNPDALVVIKGPHVETAEVKSEMKPIHLGDMAGPLVRQMMVKVFQGLHDKVLYLDLWDMSIAAENKDIHPADFVKHAMIDYLLDHICPIRNEH